MHRIAATLAAFVLLLLLSAPLHAQRGIAAGDVVEDRLTAGDPATDDGVHYHIFRFVGHAGQHVEITLSSDDFAPRLSWGVARDGVFREGDAEAVRPGADGTIGLRATVAGTDAHYVLVRAGTPGETGAYRLSVRELADPLDFDDAAPPPPAPPPAPPAPPPAPALAPGTQLMPEGGWRAIEDAQVGRDYLVGDAPYGPTRGNLPFGVILLRRGEPERNRRLCESFVHNISAVPDLQMAAPDLNVIATYWLLTRELSADDLVDCNVLLEAYNFRRAERILAAYGKAATTGPMGTRGPVILALQLNRGLGIPADVFLLDLSRETPDDVARITINWFDIVVDRSDDEAAAAVHPTAPAAEQNRGRGIFRRALALVTAPVREFACNILRPDRPESAVAYTQVRYIDPYISGVEGVLHVLVHGNSMVSLGAELLSGVLCPGRSASTETSRNVPEPAEDPLARRAVERAEAALVAGDEANARLWFLVAAGLGDRTAQWRIATLLMWGGGGEADHEQAVRWATEAARSGFANAQCLLGRFLMTGRGVPQDHAAALEWLHRAAQQGHARAQMLIAMAHEHGYGVTRDVITAARWYRRAATAGDYEAALALVRLGYDAVEPDYSPPSC